MEVKAYLSTSLKKKISHIAKKKQIPKEPDISSTVSLRKLAPVANGSDRNNTSIKITSETPESSSVSNDNDISISSRSSLTKAWDKLQLVGFYRFNSASLASCNQQCLRNQWCTKLPSKKDGKGNCELNKHEISIARENINFVHQENVLFSMYKKRCDRRLVLLIIYSATITTFSGANPARQARR